MDAVDSLYQETVDSLPAVDLIHHLYEVFITRCQGPLGNVIHTPTFVLQAEVLCSCLESTSREEKVMTLWEIPFDTLACHLLAVRMLSIRARNLCS